MTCCKPIRYPTNRDRVKGTYRHHGAGGLASHVNAARITVILPQRIAHHVGQTSTVAPAIMGQALRGRNIPAGAVGRRLAVNEDVSVLVRQRAVLCRAEESTGGPGARVQDEDDGRVGLEVGGDVDEHFDAGGVRAKVLDLGKGGALDVLVRLVGGDGGGRGEAREGG